MITKDANHGRDQFLIDGVAAALRALVTATNNATEAGLVVQIEKRDVNGAEVWSLKAARPIHPS